MTTETATVRVTAALLLSFALVGCASAAAARPADAEAPPDDVAATPEEAVRRAVEARGTAYAGACAASRSPGDVGKTCATLVAERPGLRAYLVGRTFSEFAEWLFIERVGGGWRLAGRVPLDLRDTSGAVPWPR